MLKLAQTDRPTDRPTDRAKTILYLRVPGVNITEIGSSPNIGKLSRIQWVLMLLKKIHNHIRIFHHGDWTINATESVNMFLPKSCKEKAPPLGGHVFHDIIGTLYRVLKRSDCPPLQNIVGATERPSALSNLARDCPDTRKNAPPPGAHVFEPTGTIFELAQDIILTNLLNKFHDDGQ
ncbi:hypothetical protein DPMN_023350 [Dreissena polymorpha]|uniref:Uncharacterized protein n=1 Tax=Dreissena polymorpha TaxID=45954 RepID=A0A9D4LKK2_DREPO|nr:hypothetical protein DPMN_023350 [Dreissena polymorpha]